MIKIYFSNYSKQLSNTDFSRYLHLLPSQLRQRIIRFQKWEDQHASLYGKLLLMKGLEYAGCNADLSYLKYNHLGRPYIAGAPDFNISHAGTFAVCAISYEGRIGIDIEKVKPVSIDDFKEAFSKTEWKIITGSDNPTYWFYYYWTAKEAAIKADGNGLSWMLKELEIKDGKVTIDTVVWFIKKITFADDYLLHIATNKFIATEIEVTEISF